MTSDRKLIFLKIGFVLCSTVSQRLTSKKPKKSQVSASRVARNAALDASGPAAWPLAVQLFDMEPQPGGGCCNPRFCREKKAEQIGGEKNLGKTMILERFWCHLIKIPIIVSILNDHVFSLVLWFISKFWWTQLSDVVLLLTISMEGEVTFRALLATLEETGEEARALQLLWEADSAGSECHQHD